MTETIAIPVPKQGLRPAELQCRVFDSFEDAAPLREQWDALVQSCEGELYLSFDWCRIWWRHYGRRRKLRLFVFTEGERLVGLVPMFVERAWIGPIPLRIAKMVGSDFALALFAPAVQCYAAARAYQRVLAALVREGRCDAVWFGPLPGTAAAVGAADAIRDACQRLPYLRVARDTEFGPHTIFELPDRFEAYVNSLNKRQRQNFRRDSNLLAKSFTITNDVVRDPRDAEAEFDNFKAMHDRQWQAEGRLGHFGDWPGSEAFNRDVVRELAPQGRVRFVRIRADERVVSWQYAFVFGNSCLWRLPARACEGDWERYGLGRVGLIRMIESLIAEGVTRIEAGPGHYDYKLQLGGTELTMRSVLVVSNRAGARLRSWLFRKAADLLHLAYYRIWFLRIAPRLPLPRRPLWPMWIKSRL